MHLWHRGGGGYSVCSTACTCGGGRGSSSGDDGGTMGAGPPDIGLYARDLDAVCVPDWVEAVEEDAGHIPPSFRRPWVEGYDGSAQGVFQLHGVHGGGQGHTPRPMHQHHCGAPGTSGAGWHFVGGAAGRTLPREKYKRSKATIFSVVFKYCNIACYFSIKNIVWAYLSPLILFGTYFYTNVLLISDLKVTSSKAPIALLFYWGKRGKRVRGVFLATQSRSTDEPSICWCRDDLNSCRRIWRSRLRSKLRSKLRSRPNCKAVVPTLSPSFPLLHFCFLPFLLFWLAVCVSQPKGVSIHKKEKRKRTQNWRLTLLSSWGHI